MKISIERLKQIIKEEVTKSNDESLIEMVDDPALHSSAEELLLSLEELGYDSEGMRQVLEAALASLQPHPDVGMPPGAPLEGELPLQEKPEK